MDLDVMAASARGADNPADALTRAGYTAAEVIEFLPDVLLLLRGEAYDAAPPSEQRRLDAELETYVPQGGAHYGVAA